MQENKYVNSQKDRTRISAGRTRVKEERPFIAAGGNDDLGVNSDSDKAPYFRLSRKHLKPAKAWMSETRDVINENDEKTSSDIQDGANPGQSSSSSSNSNNNSENPFTIQLGIPNLSGQKKKIDSGDRLCTHCQYPNQSKEGKRKMSSHDTTSEPPKKHNINSNNNKKRKLSALSNAKKNSKFLIRRNTDRNLRDDTNSSPVQGKNFRKHSFQLSSIRYHAPLEFRKRNTKFRRNTEYGQRLIAKNGTTNLLVAKPESRLELYIRYVRDHFTTLLDSSWTLVLIITSIVYISHWLIFGGFYLAFELVYQNHENSAEILANMTSNSSSQFGNYCVSNVYDFRTAFLFSLESETSIGYGYRTIKTACPPAIVCLVLQCIVSAIFDTWVIGMCFARLARPDARCMTTLFSKSAVVCERDGKKCLLIRFSNLRKSLLLNVSVKGRLITWRDAQSKEKNAGFQRMLEQRMVVFKNESSALLTQPIDYCHVIDANSPLYDFRPDQFNSPNGANYFELICIVTGTLESTGLTMQAQTSYLSSEVLYGYRFKRIVSKCPKKGSYVVDFNLFHSTYKEPSKRTSKFLRFYPAPEPLIEEEDSSNNDSIKALHTKAESVV